MAELGKHQESHIKIYWTKEYGKFKFLKGNRDINEPKIKKIIKVIEGGLDILSYAPIIVNTQMEILDGQHRFVVAQQMKKSVYYIVSAGIEAKSVPKINSNSSNWKKRDYLNSFVDLKKPAYLELKELLDKHPKLTIPVGASLLYSGLGDSRVSVDEFINGTLEINHSRTTENLLKKLSDFLPYTKNPFARRMVQVITELVDNGKYNHDLMIEKLELSGRRIEQISSSKSILQDMESIINHKARKRILIH